MKIEGKIAVVTGAASGIGEAVALELAKRGVKGMALADCSIRNGKLAHERPKRRSACDRQETRQEELGYLQKLRPLLSTKVAILKAAIATRQESGLTGAATTSVTMLEANTNGIRWLCPIVSGYSAGTLTVKARGVSNT